MILRFAAALLLLCAQARADSTPEGAWPTTMTVHFIVHHPTMHLPKDLLSNIEHSHQKITHELWSMASGMQGSKIDFYFYPDRDSYLAGSFGPPPWSAGRSIAQGFPNRKLLFVTYDGVRPQLITHELTHLFFGAYWDKPANSPPVWLNEGLAVMMEGRSTELLDPIPFKDFLERAPQNDDPASRVNDWYTQAGSVVTFMLKTHSSARFKIFCDNLRDGLSLVDALRRSYGFASVGEFEKAWKKWAKTQPHETQ
jgi:hypothetical protein